VEPSGTRFGSPESYTPKHLAEKILTSKSALEGERKQVTVLFADLKGSMELLADRDPEEARELLDPVLERMMEAVHRYEGTVNQVMGDGIMALFGAPVAHEDHAVRACYAALDMQAAIRRYADEIRRTQGIALDIRVGLNSGEVVVRAIGSDLHMDYTAVGQTTHLAARMEQLARPGSTFLTADTLRLAEGYVQVKPLGPVPIKGLDASIEVYEMTGAGVLRSRLNAAAARGLTRFVGRESELEQLRQALGRVAAGRGQVVAIVGEPGVGKSRLVWELTHSHRTHGWLVARASSVSYGRATPYLPVVSLLKSYFAIEDGDSPRAVQEKVTGKLLTLDRALEGNLPPLWSLLDVPADNPAWSALDPPQRRRRTLDAVKRLVLRESQVQPLLVIFEDLHWIDSETQALLDGLVESLPAARLLLLVNYRPEYQHAWGSRTYYTQLRLDPLPPESAEQLLAALLGPDTSLEALKRALIARTEGNPFFLEESVRSLAETGSLLGERGAYRATRPIVELQVPGTVQAVLAARIDRLLPEDKALLQTASVVGTDVPVILLQAIAEPDENELYAALGRLQAAEFLYETGLPPDPAYTFKHALTHDVAYGSLLQDRRRDLHDQIVAAIERLYADRLPEHVERLADHAVRGEAWEKALAYLRKAGAKAMTRSAHREAVTAFDQALTVLTHLPETCERTEQAIDLRLELRYALSPLGEWDRALAHVRDAQTLAEALGDQARLGRALVNITEPLAVQGHHDRAAEAGERALMIATASNDFGLQMDAMFDVALISGILGDYRRAVALLRETVKALVGEWIHWGTPGISSILSRAFLGSYLALLGEFPEAIERSEEGVRIAEETGQPFSRIHAHSHAADVHLSRGDIPHAIARAGQALQLSHDWSLPAPRSYAAATLALAYARAGRLDEALSVAAQVAGSAKASFTISRLGEAYFVAGRLADAAPLADRALTLARDQKERGHEALALHLLAEIAAHRDPPDVEAAHGHYRGALALADELGMRPLVAHCHLGLGKLYRRRGDGSKADEHLTTAATMYREMDMAFWLEKSEAEMRGLA
jgi:class 3 adenylate cyclase/tetratricopeptide (TPR) repeat protein